MLGADERLQQTLEFAYRHLNRRDRTEAEVRAHLEHHGLVATEIEPTIELLIDQGYLDDARFARLFTQDKRHLEHWGNDRIRRALSDRKIERELIDQTLNAEPAEAQLDRALELLRRRFPLAPRERRERDRALGVLRRKGFDGELALDALAAYAGEAPQPGLR